MFHLLDIECVCVFVFFNQRKEKGNAVPSKSTFVFHVYYRSVWNAGISCLLGWFVILEKGFWALWGSIYECICWYNRCLDDDVREFWALWDNIYGNVCVVITQGNAFKGFWVLWDNIYKCKFSHNYCHNNAVRGFGFLWCNIYVYVFTSDFSVIRDGQFTNPLYEAE
jgi:hypothetical protein